MLDVRGSSWMRLNTTKHDPKSLTEEQSTSEDVSIHSLIFTTNHLPSFIYLYSKHWTAVIACEWPQPSSVSPHHVPGMLLDK